MYKKQSYLHLIPFIFIFGFKSFSQELKAFKAENLYGYKYNGDTIIKPKYQYAGDFVLGNGIVYKKGKAGVIDRYENNVIPFEFYRIYNLTDSIFKVVKETKYLGEYRYGILSYEGDTILPIKYKNVYLKKDKLFVELQKDSLISENKLSDVISYKTTYGIYNLDGSPILKPIYDWFDQLNTDTLKVNKDNFYAMVKTNGEFLTKLKYTAFGDFYNGKAKIRIDSLFGFIDKSGTEIIEPQFYSVSSFYRNLTVFRKHNGNVGFLNDKGEIIFERKYEILRYPHLNCAAARVDKKWGLIDLDGNILIPFIHDDYYREFEGIISYRKNGKWAIFDSKGSRLTEYRFDSIFLFGDKESPSGSYYKLKPNKYKKSIAFVEDDGKYGVINSQGKFLFPLNDSKKTVFEYLDSLKIRN